MRAQNQLVRESVRLAYLEKTMQSEPKTRVFLVVRSKMITIFSARAFGARECLLSSMHEARSKTPMFHDFSIEDREDRSIFSARTFGARERLCSSVDGRCALNQLTRESVR